MTTNHLLQATAAEEEQSRYEDDHPQRPRPSPPRLVPPLRKEARPAATLPDSEQRATARVFAWKLLDPFTDSFELWAGNRPLARLTLSGLAFPSATMDTKEHRLLLAAKGVGNRWVTISDANTKTLVANFEWQRLGRKGTLRLVTGGQLKWRRTGLWHPTFTFTDRFGNLLLRFRPDGRALGYGLNAQLNPPPGSRGDRTLLLALGWFLLLSSGTAAPPQPVAMP